MLQYEGNAIPPIQGMPFERQRAQAQHHSVPIHAQSSQLWPDDDPQSLDLYLPGSLIADNPPYPQPYRFTPGFSERALFPQEEHNAHIMQ